MVGLIFRPRGRRLRMGLDSRTVLLLYALGLGGLIAIGGA
jgi:cation:H+ antiporter